MRPASPSMAAAPSSATCCSRRSCSGCMPWQPRARPSRPPCPRQRFEDAMKFAAVIEYIQDKEKIAAVRPVHRQYLASLKEKGQLAISGPFTDDYGALIVYEAATKEE